MIFRPWPKRDPVKNYFPLPKEIFSPGLRSGEILVYAYLLYCEDRKTYQCWPSCRTIGKAVGMSPNTVRKYVAGLEEKRLITTERTTVTTRDGRRRNGSLRYTIRPVQDALEYYYDKQLKQLDIDRQRDATPNLRR